MEQQKLTLDDLIASALRAQNVYDEPYEGGGVAIELPNNKGRMVLRDDTQNKILTITLRGTANSENVLDDVKFRPVADPVTGVKVHRGFNEPAQEAWEKLLDFISSPVYDGYEFIVEGHSLGGAEAVLLVMKLVHVGRKVRHLITFGQPMVGTEEAIGPLLDGIDYVRVVNRADTVPWTPPVRRMRDMKTTIIGYISMLFFGGKTYGHVGELFHLFPTELEDLELPKLELSWRGVLRWLGNIGKRSLDHPMKKYVASLRRMSAQQG